MTHAPRQSGGRPFGLLVGVLVVAGLLALGIAPRMRQEQKLKAAAAKATSEATPVNVVRGHFAHAGNSLDLPGSIQAIEETTINARTSGYVARWYDDIGARVRAGQTLAEIDAPEVDQQLMQARAETSKNEAGSEQAQADVSRQQANVAQANAQLVSLQSGLQSAIADVTHAQAKQMEAQNAVEEANATLMQARKKLSGRKANLSQARTHLALTDKTYRRWQELAKGGAVSGQDLDETQAAFESAQSGVEAAQADVDSAQADVDAAQAAVRAREGNVAAAQADVSAAREKVNAAKSAIVSGRANIQAIQAGVQAGRANVRAAQAGVQASVANANRYRALRGFERVVAPFTGVITARNIDVGDLVNAGGSTNTSTDQTVTVPHSGLFGIARTDVLRIQVNVPESAIGSIRTGDKARIQVQELPGRTFTGSVWRMAGALDATSRTVMTEVRVPNPDGALMPGMYAQVQFQTTQTHPLLRIPASTLVVDSEGTRVATVTPEHRIHYKTVRLGRDFGKEVEINQGLDGREALVSNPTDDLKEGTPVQIIASE